VGFFDSQLTPGQKRDVRQGLTTGLRNLVQTSPFYSITREGIPAMPGYERFSTVGPVPRFDTQILFGTSRNPGSTPASSGRGTPPPAPVLPAPITSPNTTFQNADEEYKTLLSQYGGTSGVQQLAGMQTLPTGFTPTGGKQAAGLEDYYAAQRAVGSKNIGEIAGALGYQKGSPMEQWAKANPMLAMREYNEKFPAGAPTQGPSDEAIRAAMGGGTYFPSEGSPSPVANAPTLAGQTSFGNIANPVAPATALNQGAAMDANRGKENLVPQQAAKTTPDGEMPNLPTTLERVGRFLQGSGVGSALNAAGSAGLSKLLNVY
jgi:hypothetical protein